MDLVDEGYVRVRLVGADGVPAEATIDLFLAWSKVRDASREALQAGDDDAVYFGKVTDFLVSQGLPRVSWAAAADFASAVCSLVEAHKKKRAGASTPASPASTASTPGG